MSESVKNPVASIASHLRKSREERVVKSIVLHLHEQTRILQTVNKMVVDCFEGLEKDYPGAFGKRPCWPELALDNALEYMHEAAGAFEDVMLKFIKEEYQNVSTDCGL